MKVDTSKRLQKALGPILATCLLSYFVYHLIQGERGLLSWMRLKQKIKIAEEKLTQIQEEQINLAHRVHLMSPNTLDIDMLEEQAREKLGLANNDELIIHDKDIISEDRLKKK